MNRPRLSYIKTATSELGRTVVHSQTLFSKGEIAIQNFDKAYKTKLL